MTPSPARITDQGPSDIQSMLSCQSKSKKVVNHKTRQVETRIQRQIVMEDGKVIADSGPQVTQRTKEDIKTEELEGSSGKGKNGVKSDLNPGLEGYKALPGESVVSEKVETRNTTREARQEQLQYHDESIKELTGYDIHRKALASPNELIKLDDGDIDSTRPPGKLIHYAAKSKKFADREELKEVSKRQRDGTITTERIVTMHHEEIDDDELPEDQLGQNALPEASKETTKEIHYHKDWNDSQKSTNRSKYAVEEDRKSENRSRFSSVDRKSESGYDKDRSTSIGRRSQSQYASKEASLSREDKYRREEKSIPIEKEYSPCHSPESQSKQETSSIGKELHRSRFDKYGANYEEKRSQSMSRRDESRFSNRSVSSSIKEKPFKEDASVQASFSEDSSDDEAYGRSSSWNRKKYGESEIRSHSVKVDSGSYEASKSSDTVKPKGSYYFGQDRIEEPLRSSSHVMKSDRYSTAGQKRYETSTDRKHVEREEMRSSASRSEEKQQTKSSIRSSSSMEKPVKRESESADWFNTLDARTLMDELERECQTQLNVKDSDEATDFRSKSRSSDCDGRRSRVSTTGEIKGNVKHEFKSTANGKVTNDTSRNEAFQQSFNNSEERENATRSFNKLMDTTFGRNSRQSMSPLLYDGSIRHIPIERPESSAKSRIESQSRSSSAACDYDFNTTSRKAYNSSRNNSPGRLSDRYRYTEDRSPSRSPERRGTFTKSRASPTITNNNDYSPFKSELMRKSPYFSGENRNY